MYVGDIDFNSLLLSGRKSPCILKQYCSYKLQVCFKTYHCYIPPIIKQSKSHKLTFGKQFSEAYIAAKF